METQPKQFNWNDYFSFKTMISLRIIQIFYLVGAVGTTLTGLYWLFSGAGMGGTGHFIGLMILSAGNVLWRVWCELMIVFFRINETLNSVDQNTKKGIL